jgi:hypothetical protein
MKRIEICVRDESGEVISDQELPLDIGSGRFDEIEQAVERFRQRALKGLEGDLLKQEQARFVEQAKKGGATD